MKIRPFLYQIGRVLCLILFLLISGLVQANDDYGYGQIPELKHRVTDLTYTLSTKETKTLEHQLAQLEQKKGSQIFVLMVPTIQPESIESYATRVFDKWKIGRKNINDGVLLVIAKNDHKMRIEVGYGLEGAIPDILAGRIIRNDIAPKFKQGNYYEGIKVGIDRLTSLINGESLPEPKKHKKNKAMPIEAIIAFLGVSLMALYPLLASRSKFIPLLLGFMGAVIMGSLLIGLICFIIGIIIWLLMKIFAPFLPEPTSYNNYIHSDSSDWDSSDFGGDGDSFSGGGGGESGGGGASGDW